MTVTEHLQFSVLSAPLATIDRRCLSQAWYAALFPTAAASAAPLPGALKPFEHFAQTVCKPQIAVHSRTPIMKDAFAPAVKCGSSTVAAAPCFPERRAARSSLANKIIRGLEKRMPPAGSAGFSIENAGRRVQLLIQARGTTIYLIALCSPKDRSEVLQALRQARYALVARGIRLETQTRERRT